MYNVNDGSSASGILGGRAANRPPSPPSENILLNVLMKPDSVPSSSLRRCLTDTAEMGKVTPLLATPATRPIASSSHAPNVVVFGGMASVV